MKKFLVILLVLAVLAGAAYYVLNLANQPNIADLEATKEILENAGYSVSYTDNSESEDRILKYFMATDEEENALVVMVLNDKEYAKLYYKELKLQLEYQTQALKVRIDMYEYELEHGEDLSDSEIESIKKSIESAEENLEQYEKIVLGRNGDTIWYGTKDAIKASRG